MRSADEIRLDIGATASEITAWEQHAAKLRRRLASCLLEARDHPEVTLEEARRIPEQELSRMTTHRLIREAEARATQV